MLPKVLQLENLGEKLSKLAGICEKKPRDANLTAVSVLRCTDGAKHHLIAALPLRRVVITADNQAAKSLASKLSKYPGQDAYYIASRDDTLVPHGEFTGIEAYGRSSALTAAANGNDGIFVLSADAAKQLFPARELQKKYTVNVRKNDEIQPSELALQLVKSGYTRREMVSEAGEFALRGDILDVFSVDGKAVRINFFDELIEDIKVIDPLSMLAGNELECVCFPPASDILIDEKNYEKTKEKLKKYAEINKYAAQILSRFSVGALDKSAVWAAPFMLEAQETVFEFFDDGNPTVFIFDEPKVIFDKFQLLEKEFSGRIETLTASGEITAEHAAAEVTFLEIKRQILLKRVLSFSSLTTTNPLFNPKYLIEPKNRPVTKYYLDPSSVYADMNAFILNGFKVLIAAGSEERAKGVITSLAEENVYAEYSEDGNGESSVLATPLSIENGVIYPALKICLVGYAECVGKQRGQDVKIPKTQFSAPKAGDYVVHRVHGVGICEGTKILKTGEFEKEYVVLKYLGGDTLYVASDQTDNLQKFVGEENPRLNKLGGREFEREKEKVKKSVRKLAVNLLELYSKRQKQKGFKYSPDTVWQHEFEDAFEYDETADQLKAVEAVKEDMESGKIMDRLLIGDVGFGKTEVAFRAMFKTVLDGKQAVLLAPTTILARQHHENINKRLKPFGIKCGLLSRLSTPAENAETISELADGTMQIVVATHKVLSSAVSFCDLGLLVLDEEQRFGVEHKEKLKERYPLVNVLTLSATPIPRTLNMALSGVRDISMLETAPAGRLPVQTYVLDYSDSLVADAVKRETARGGQTLILLNDIDKLEVFAARLRDITGGNIGIVTAHGQMASGQLENKIAAFYDKKYDVLISTTIIENGIDLPDANTLIVLNSGNFGLSQLYQLRGRVGRRGTLAHAYFTLPPNGAMSSTAEKRLRALLENTEIGSGFKIALSDLSIRGAGSLLGAEQSGHIERVGYEMYLEMLDDAVEELRTGKIKEEVRDVEMKIDAAAYIREGYVSGRDKLRVYRQISEVAGFAARDRLIKELGGIYGTVDLPLENLINIALLKNLVRVYGVSRVIINRNGAAVNFYDTEAFKNEQIMRAVSMNADKTVLTNTIPPSLIFEVNKTTAEQKIERVLSFFAAI